MTTGRDRGSKGKPEALTAKQGRVLDRGGRGGVNTFDYPRSKAH